MTDRELLEMAARAAGIDLADASPSSDGTWIFRAPKTPNWNPLTDDGDALRLAVKLKFLIDVDGFFCTTVTDGATADKCELHNGEPEVATRLAIVKAAAEIGKSMKDAK